MPTRHVSVRSLRAAFLPWNRFGFDPLLRYAYAALRANLWLFQRRDASERAKDEFFDGYLRKCRMTMNAMSADARKRMPFQLKTVLGL